MEILRLDSVPDEHIIKPVDPVEDRIIGSALTKPKNEIVKNQIKPQKADESQVQKPLKRGSTFEIKI